ncbi:MAG: WbqC family protein [Schleiferiaceae bacterium]
MQTLLSTAYFPPIIWVAYAVQSEELRLESHENFQKQSYRSRTDIAGPNGKQTLSVPVDRSIKSILTIPISYQEDWVSKHLKSIETAYANSPFFEVLFPDVEELLKKEYSSLWSLNLATIQLFFHWLELSNEVPFTSSYETVPNVNDARSLHPKEKLDIETPTYLQVFEQKNGFMSNLSALDVFFNLGRSSWDYFQEINLRQK